MLIQCTKKLLDQLNIKPESQVDEDPLFSWHANLITVDRRKAVVLVNDNNRYAIVLHGLKAKDFLRLEEHILQAICETLRDEEIKNEIIDQFINSSREITYAKTKNRSMVARMNKACEILYYYKELMEDDSIYKTSISIKASRYLVSDGKNNYIRPHEEMYKDLEAFTGKSIFGSKAVVLRVTLDLEMHNVWRKIVIPVNMTFSDLHEIIQVAFGWRNYHLHEFYIYNDEKSGSYLSINHCGYNKDGFKPIVNLVCTEEALDYENDVPMKFEKGIKLLEYIPAKIKYNYDFGDNWQHYIEVEKIIDDYGKNYPVCLDGEGDTPPEDVGGESGYEEFLWIMADKKHPEYMNMVKWGMMQGYKDFDIKMVNSMLKHL